MIALTDLTPEEMAGELSLKPYQGRQIFQWFHKKQIFEFEKMTNLSKELRHHLQETCLNQQIHPINRLESTKSPGTVKVLFRLRDGFTVESVVIRDNQRITLCVSTQVGCAIRCAFCATGLGGFHRNLTSGEIVEQVLHLVAIENIKEKHPNIVYMGMGEPFRNYENTIKSIRLLLHTEGMNIGSRRITVSTAGDIEGIRRFAEEGWQVRLSISLHAATNDLRSTLVPLNKKYPLDALMDAIHFYINKTGRHVTFEWVLLSGINDTPDQAKKLAMLVKTLPCTVNLIPYNPVEPLPYKPPELKTCRKFQQILQKEGINCTIRKERGTDISAACGQLMMRHCTQSRNVTSNEAEKPTPLQQYSRQ